MPPLRFIPPTLFMILLARMFGRETLPRKSRPDCTAWVFWLAIICIGQAGWHCDVCCEAFFPSLVALRGCVSRCDFQTAASIMKSHGSVSEDCLYAVWGTGHRSDCEKVINVTEILWTMPAKLTALWPSSSMRLPKEWSCLLLSWSGLRSKGQLLNDTDVKGLLDSQYFGLCPELRHLGCLGRICDS